MANAKMNEEKAIKGQQPNPVQPDKKRIPWLWIGAGIVVIVVLLLIFKVI